eukprot:3477698-Amphidinium_carterae.1
MNYNHIQRDVMITVPKPRIYPHSQQIPRNIVRFSAIHTEDNTACQYRSGHNKIFWFLGKCGLRPWGGVGAKSS